MASIFKSLSPTDYSIVPFPAYYKFSYTYESGSLVNSPDVVVSYGEKFLTESGIVRVPNPTYELFDSVIQTFYSPIPYATYGTRSTSYIPSASVYVISVSQDVFGEKVLPGSFSIQIAGTQSYDDGKGNLIVSSSGIGGVVGRIFYDKGIAVFQPTSSISGGGLNNAGIFIGNGTAVNIQFSSSIKLYENAFKIKLAPTEFLYQTNNPSITTKFSGSSENILDLIASRSFIDTGSLPYVTTIGLYNEQNELLLVAKPSVPVQRTSDVIQTFIVKFDI
jgi:hypothetical protein